MPHLLLVLSLLSGTVSVGPTFLPAAGRDLVPEARDTVQVPAGAVSCGSTAALVLVRHGETAPDGTRDPALSPEGHERARELADLLADAGVVEVWSTDLRRTRATAGPLAHRAGVEVGIYDPFDTAPFRARLRDARGTVVVVGHSNTTPALVEALGGRAGPPIEEWEHDRLYVLLPGGSRGGPHGSDGGAGRPGEAGTGGSRAAGDRGDPGPCWDGDAIRTLRLRYGPPSRPDVAGG